MKKYFFVILTLIFNIYVFAHPHMFFSSSIEFTFAGKKLKGANVTWTFDRYFSADIISGYDINKDGLFDEAETKDVFENAFSYTSNYYYFCFIRQGNKRSSPASVSSFRVKAKNGIISYSFYVDLSKFEGHELFFAVYDYTFFCDITYDAKNAVTFNYPPGTVSPTFRIVENKDYPVYYNPVGPIDDTRIYYKWKPGLETYYPKEISIKY